jgi:hypothetical protein
MAAGDRTAARRGATVSWPGYGHLDRSLGLRWEHHPLCPYLANWVCELWPVPCLLPPAARPRWAGQAGWQARLLTAVAARLAAATSRCDHARDRGQAISRLVNHPADDHTRTGGAS